MSSRLDRAALVASFQGYGSGKQLVGGEFERAVVQRDGRAISYEEHHGIRWYLEEFARRWGWSIVLEDDHPIALLKDGANLTLEPGGQIELSGAPHASLLELERELNLNRAQLVELAKDAGHVAIASGLTPIASIESVRWMPKGRYAIMREYLGKRGELAHFMMKGTTSVQANFDYVDEDDCAEKVAIAAGLAPLVTAIFASSPLYENKPTGFQSMRANVWRHTDPDRTGFPAPIGAPAASAPATAASSGAKGGADGGGTAAAGLDASAISQTLGRWAAITVPGRVLAVFDVSGSMLTKVPTAGGLTRAQVTQRAAAQGLELFDDKWAVGTWLFSTNMVGKRPWKEVVPITPLSSARGTLQRSISQIVPKPGGATGLYDTALAAYKEVQDGWQGGRINSVILFTDGKNENKDGITRDQLVAQLKKLNDPKRPVRMIVIGIGGEVDRNELEAITDATSAGGVFIAPDPAKIGEIFLEAIASRSGANG